MCCELCYTQTTLEWCFNPLFKISAGVYTGTRLFLWRACVFQLSKTIISTATAPSQMTSFCNPLSAVRLMQSALSVWHNGSHTHSLKPRLSVLSQLWRKIGGKAWTNFSRDRGHRPHSSTLQTSASRRVLAQALWTLYCQRSTCGVCMGAYVARSHGKATSRASY